MFALVFTGVFAGQAYAQCGGLGFQDRFVQRQNFCNGQQFLVQRQRFVVPNRQLRIVEVPGLVQRESVVAIRDRFGRIQNVRLVERFVDKGRARNSKVRVQQQIIRIR